MYARKKEDDMERIFVDEFGCKLVEDTGRRKKFHADKIFESTNGHLLVVDHKSTIGTTEIGLKKEWIEKVRMEADSVHSQAMGLVTISYKNSHKMLVVMDLDDFYLLIR
jgi:hypothetical protein